MRVLLVFLLFCGYTLFARWYYVCEIHGPCGENAEDIRLQTLSLRDGGQIILQGYDQFAFDSAALSPRLNKNNRIFLDSVTAYLEAHPQKHLTITGRYRESEEGITPGFFENLGVARAAEIRRALVRRGIGEKRITLDYQQSPSEALREPLRFVLYAPSESPPDAFEKNSFTFTNMTFSQANFAFDSDEFLPGEPFRLYADSLKTYLELNPGKVLSIVGHTDHIDTEAYNYDLGLRRAKSARQFLRNMGITSEIAVESMGETRPAATNKTEEGRAKNRRVNFVLPDEGQ